MIERAPIYLFAGPLPPKTPARRAAGSLPPGAGGTPSGNGDTRVSAKLFDGHGRN